MHRLSGDATMNHRQRRTQNTMSFDLADPSVMLCALTTLIVTCAALDLPAFAAALRFFRLRRRFAYARRRELAPTRARR